MDDTYIKAGSAISRASTLGTGALTGSITGGLGSLSRTDEPARLIGGFTGGALGGTVGSILPAAVLNSQTAVKMLNSPKAKGFATLFKILNVLLSAGGGAVGSRMGENVASVIKNNMGNKVNAMYKQSSTRVNVFGNGMNTFTPHELLNFVKNMNS